VAGLVLILVLWLGDGPGDRELDIAGVALLGSLLCGGSLTSILAVAIMPALRKGRRPFAWLDPQPARGARDEPHPSIPPRRDGLRGRCRRSPDSGAVPTKETSMRLDGPITASATVWLALGSALAAGGLLAGCARLPDDGKDAKVMRFDGLRAMRYCEVFLFGGDPVIGNLRAEFYNTTGLNNSVDSRDTCPAAIWDKVDAEAQKKKFDVLGVFKNGPRHWATDWIELPVGAQRDFDGLQARWMGQVKLPKDVKLHEKGSSAYKPTTAHRKSKMGFAKGQPVFVLVSPDGMPWVMHAYSLSVDPRLAYADLENLGSKLRLAPGWRYRVNVLDEDLRIQAVNGVARIVQDDLESTYDACFEEGGQKSCSIMP
jgi:hypothetical protein